MSTSTCRSCHNLLRQRLRAHIIHLQSFRRAASSTAKPSLSSYFDTTAPTAIQLTAAERFFLTHKPRKLWTATEWRKHNDTSDTSPGLIPEVAFLGRSNVGKSSLLNAILISPGLNHVGPRPGKTTTMHAWGLAATDPKTGGAVKGMKGDMETKCAVLDMPGYGYASHDDWGEEIMAYLRNRKQLKRAFVLVDGRHGLKSGDLTMLRLLRKQGISAQVVASKFDVLRVGEGEEVVKKLWHEVQEKVQGPGLGVLGEVLAVGNVGDGRKNERVHYNLMKGVDEVQWAILRASGLDQYAMNQLPRSMKASTSPPAPRQPHKTVSSSSQKSPSSPSTAPVLSRPGSLREGLETPAKQPSTSTLRPMHPPAALSQPDFISSLLADISGPISNPALQPKQPAIGRGIDELLSMTSKSPAPAPTPETAYNLMANVSKVGRDARKMAKSQRARKKEKGRKAAILAAEKASPREEEAIPLRPQQKETWTGSAVGGMADLQAMMARTSAPGVGTGKKKRQAAMLQTGQLAPSDEEASSLQQQQKETWNGSAVGGMADLEAMMARTSARPGLGNGRKRH